MVVSWFPRVLAIARENLGQTIVSNIEAAD